MRTPLWIHQEIAQHGALMLEGNATEAEATTALTNQVFAKDGALARAIVNEWLRKKVISWADTHQRGTSKSAEHGQLDLFPNLPRKVEVSPGRFAAQASMTGHDWDTALKCAEAKEQNASGYAEKIRAAYDKVRPLLTDDSMTTADVWPNQMPVALFGSGS